MSADKVVSDNGDIQNIANPSGNFLRLVVSAFEFFPSMQRDWDDAVDFAVSGVVEDVLSDGMTYGYGYISVSVIF